MLAQKLLASPQNMDNEYRTLELLKLRFGEASLHACEVMHTDLLAQLSAERSEPRFAWFNLAAREFPVPAVRLAGGATRNGDTTICAL